jgi:hypothetical protein
MRIIETYEDSRRYEAPPEYGYPDSPDPMDVAHAFNEQESIDNESEEP